MGEYKFPDGFFWGTAVSSHQVEGNNKNNDWWEFEMRGKVKDGQISGLACDHWNRYEKDFELIKELNNNAYRFSIEWSRIEPKKEFFDDSAIGHYKKMIISLKNRNIEPFVTLHHFTNPIWISKEGGWLNPKTIDYFLEYVERVVREFKDLVKFWISINEPNAYAFTSYLMGMFPPQEKSLNKMITVLNNMVKAHAKAYHIIHNIVPNAKVSVAYNFMIFDPINPYSFFDKKVQKFIDRLYNLIFLETLITGKFSSPFKKENIVYAKDTLDYIGVNYYTRLYVGFDLKSFPNFVKLYVPEEVEKSDFGWEIYPEGLYRVLKRFWNMIGKPIVITENGISDSRDEKRPKYIISHILELHKAINDSINVLGYFYWSLMDNFEWAEGFLQRFGLFEVDFDTQERKWRESAKIYAEIAKNNSISQELVEKYIKIGGKENGG